MTEEQERNIRRRKLSECVTSNEDLLCRVLSYCTAEHLGTSAIFVNQLWSDAGKNDSIWRSISLRRWKGMRNERMWISRSTKKEDTTKWFDCYKKSVKEIRRTIPIFAMGCRLEQGMGMGLNFFEPRYKWLIQRIQTNNLETGSSRDEFDPNIFKNSNDQLFCFCTSAPVREGTIGWITRACHVNVRPDGGSDFIALPLAKCVLKEVWIEEVPQEISGVGYRVPPLSVCVCEELSLQQDSDTSEIESGHWNSRLPGFVRRRGQRGGGENLLMTMLAQLLARTRGARGDENLTMDELIELVESEMGEGAAQLNAARYGDDGHDEEESDDDEENGK